MTPATVSDLKLGKATEAEDKAAWAQQELDQLTFAQDRADGEAAAMETAEAGTMNAPPTTTEVVPAGVPVNPVALDPSSSVVAAGNTKKTPAHLVLYRQGAMRATPVVPPEVGTSSAATAAAASPALQLLRAEKVTAFTALEHCGLSEEGLQVAKAEWLKKAFLRYNVSPEGHSSDGLPLAKLLEQPYGHAAAWPNSKLTMSDHVGGSAGNSGDAYIFTTTPAMRQGRENVGFIQRWEKNCGTFKVNSVRSIHLALREECMAENIRAADIIVNKTTDAWDGLTVETDRLLAEASVATAAARKQIQDSITSLESQLAVVRSEELAEIAAHKDHCQSVMEDRDGLWAGIEETAYEELRLLALEPPVPCPGHAAYLAQTGEVVSHLDSRVWRDLLGSCNCVSDSHNINYTDKYSEEYLEVKSLINEINDFINNMMNHCADLVPEVPVVVADGIAGGSHASGGSTGDLPSGTPLPVNNNTGGNNGQEVSFNTPGSIPGSIPLLPKVKCLVTCTVGGNTHVLFIKNNMGCFVWASGSQQPLDVSVKHTASRLVNSQATLLIDASEWSSLGVDMDMDREGQHIMKTHIDAVTLPSLKTTRDGLSMRAVWVPLIPALSLIRQPTVFNFEYVGTILFDHLSETFPMQWHMPLMGASAIEYLSPNGPQIDLIAARPGTVGTNPTGTGLQTPSPITNNGTNRQLFNTDNLRVPDVGNTVVDVHDRVVSNTSDNNVTLKLVKALVLCKIMVEKTPQVLLIQNSSGKWGLPTGTIDILEQSVAISATRLVKDQTGFQVVVDKWQLIGYEHQSVDTSTASLVYNCATNNLPRIKTQSDSHSVESRWIPLQAVLDLIRVPGILDKSDIGEAAIAYLHKTFQEECVRTPDMLAAAAVFMPISSPVINTGHQQQTTPTFNSGVGKLIPLPQKWNTSKITTLPKPKIWLSVVDDYMVAANWNYPVHFVFFLEGDVLEWWYMLKQARDAAGIPLDKAFIVKSFLERYTTNLLKESTQALQKLMNGSISLSSSKDLHDYETAFRNCVRECGNITEDSQIQFFLKGLTDTLKAQCIHCPLTNKEFSCFEDLVTHAKAKYAVLSMFASETPNVNYFAGDTKQNPYPKQPLDRLQKHASKQQTKEGWRQAVSSKRPRDTAPTPAGGRGRGREPQRDAAGRGGRGGGPREPLPPPPTRPDRRQSPGRGGRDGARGSGAARAAYAPQIHQIEVQGKSSPDDPDDVALIGAACNAVSIEYNPHAVWKLAPSSAVTTIPAAHQQKLRVDGRCIMCKSLMCRTGDRRKGDRTPLCTNSVVAVKGTQLVKASQAANWAVRTLGPADPSGFSWDWNPEVRPFITP